MTINQIPKDLVQQIKDLIISHKKLSLTQANNLSDKQVIVLSLITMLPKKDEQDSWLDLLDNKNGILHYILKHHNNSHESNNVKSNMTQINHCQYQLNLAFGNIIQYQKFLDRKVNGLNTLIG